MKVLNHGEVRLMDVMGNDGAIVQAARVSYDPDSTKITNDDKGLINYLMRHKHTTPFEMVEFKFFLKMPIFVARQWIRHRTANINEYSARYSVVKEEFFSYDQYQNQSKTNKQGRGTDETGSTFPHRAAQLMLDSFDLYNDMVSEDVSREQARIHLPLSTYTQFIWKIDLHNLFHFLKLRMDSHAQYEIRVYAEVLANLVKQTCPLAYEAFENYSLNAYTMSHRELRALRAFMKLNEVVEGLLPTAFAAEGVSIREVGEFLTALDK